MSSFKMLLYTKSSRWLLSSSSSPRCLSFNAYACRTSFLVPCFHLRKIPRWVLQSGNGKFFEKQYTHYITLSIFQIWYFRLKSNLKPYSDGISVYNALTASNSLLLFSFTEWSFIRVRSFSVLLSVEYYICHLQ